MNDYVVSVLLGIIEGLTEFLPVSSTAHLRIGEALLDIGLDDPYWKMYTIVIQLGAILALTLLFAGRIIEFIRTFPGGEDGKHTRWNHPLTLTLVAFVCTAVPSLLLTNIIGAHLESLHAITLALIIGGIVMWAVDAWSVRRDATVTDVEQMSLPQAIWIGLCQVTSAVFPGTSRSMSTIAAGQVAGMTRSAALEFSFLVSIPTMITATLYDLVRSLCTGANPGRPSVCTPTSPRSIWTPMAGSSSSSVSPSPSSSPSASSSGSSSGFATTASSSSPSTASSSEPPSYSGAPTS